MRSHPIFPFHLPEKRNHKKWPLFWQTVAFIVYQEKSKWVFIEAHRKREKGDKEAVAQWFQ